MIRAFVYRPLANGLCRWLGPLEADVMRVMWESAAPRTVWQVQHALTKCSAYTTVMTTLNRLADKGLLTRRTSDSGRVYTYSPSCSQAEFIEIQRRAILESLHD